MKVLMQIPHKNGSWKDDDFNLLPKMQTYLTLEYKDKNSS